MEIKELIKEAYENADKHGFYEDIDNIQSIQTDTKVYSMLMNNAICTRLMLIVGEVSEAMEALRKEDMNNFKEELGDVIIRLADLSGYMGIDLEKVISEKMQKNKTRPYKHDKAF